MTEHFESEISLATPLEDYKKLYEKKIELFNELKDYDVIQKNYDEITAKLREVIWTLLFKDESPIPENLKKAGECLQQYKIDACFHAYYMWTLLFASIPAKREDFEMDMCLNCSLDYNEWIQKLRDELLKRCMFDFWNEYIVLKELGPCWARNPKCYDDFYKFE